MAMLLTALSYAQPGPLVPRGRLGAHLRLARALHPHVGFLAGAIALDYVMIPVVNFMIARHLRIARSCRARAGVGLGWRPRS